MPNKEEKSGLVVALIIRLAIGLAAALIIILAGAMLISSGTLPETAITVVPALAGLLGALWFSRGCARLVGSKAFIVGLAAGVGYFLALFFLGAIFFLRWAPGAGTVAMLLASVIGGLLGGLISAPRKRRIRERAHTYDTVRRKRR